jgi:Uri superfamily endonuclease
LGSFDFPKGKYVYTGSAKKNMDHRIKRHLSKEKKLHWHIDYFLADKNVEIFDVKKSEISECILNKKLKARIVANGLGSSDCRSYCQSHLKFLG